MLAVVKRTILESARKLFALRGYEVHKVTPVDERDEDPLYAVNERLLRRPVLVNIPVERCRGLYWFPFEEYSHPFMATLAAYREGHCTTFRESPLAEFYRRYQPRFATDVLGLSNEEAPGYSHVPALGFCMPWHPGEPSKNMQGRRRIGRLEAEKHDMSPNYAAGTNLFGPVSDKKGELEFARLTEVFESMRKSGYRRHDGEDGDVEGTLLVDLDLSWCLQIRRGHHRVAAAAALGYDKLPFRIRHTPVRPTDIDYWPQVHKGYITGEGALSIFKRVIRGQAPSTCRWPTEHATLANLP